MFESLKELVPKDRDLPERAFTLEWREQFRTGAIYANLKRAFREEKDEQDEYIPIHKRRPSVIFGLPEIIVNDSTSLLFGEGHFPAIDIEDDKVEEILVELIKETKLKATMLDAAVRGSVGSIAVLFSLKKNRAFFDVMKTQYLTPEYDPEEPDRLLRVTEKYKVRGAKLIEMGYQIEKDDAQVEFWFQRRWDRTREIWYLPWPVQNLLTDTKTPKYPAPETEDAARTVSHGFSFVPICWIKNLPGGDKFDGKCTFEAALPSSIEIDYQLSQGGRGLKYSSDPTLVIREAGYDTGDEPVLKGASNALRGGDGFDAKLLEINGTASKAVLDFVRALREFAIELCGGNRVSPEKLSGAQSGRAMELMNQALIWLADKMRSSYGEDGLITLLKMVIAANKVYPIRIAGKLHPIGTLGDPESTQITLKWPPWYQPTAQDHVQQSTALKTYRDAGVITQETATKFVQHDFDIEDPKAEVDQVNKDADARAEAAAKIEAANAPKPLSRAA